MTAPAASPVVPVKLEETERLIMLGFAGRRQAAQLAAQLACERIDREQDKFFGTLAARLEMSVDRMAALYDLDLQSMTLLPRPEPEPAPAGPAIAATNGVAHP